MFNFFGKKNTPTIHDQDRQIQESYFESLNAFSLEKIPDYRDCKEIFIGHSLGKRLVQSIIKFSMSNPRKIIIEEAPEEAIEQFQKTWDKYQCNQIVEQCLTLIRVYGMAGIYVATDKDNDDFENLKVDDVLNHKLFFNVLDPYNFRVTINQNPLSPYFLKPFDMRVGGRKVGGKRCYAGFNGSPIFLDFEASTLNFAGRSVYRNMFSFLRIWSNLYSALEKIAIKASAILISSEGNNSRASDSDLNVAQVSAMLVKQMAQGQVAFLANGQHAEFFNLNGVTEVGAMLSELKEGLAMALDDTPTAILLDRELSNGLSEGSEDMKAVVMAVNAFRDRYMLPIMEFLDSYMFYKAWSDDFIKKTMIKGDNVEKFKGLSPYEIRLMWIDNFKYEWESVYPKTPDEETKHQSMLLDNLVKLQSLGASQECLKRNIDDMQLFPNEVVLDSTPPDFEERIDV